MLHESSCKHLSLLNSLASTSDASLLDEILTEVSRTAGLLVRNCWAEHGLPEAFCHLRKEPEIVSFVSSAFYFRACITC
jgi:hypothetical protein